MSNFITANGEFCGTLHSAPRSELPSCLSEEGNFLGDVLSYRLETSPVCKAIAICVDIQIAKHFDSDEGVWHDYAATNTVITEQFCIIGCNGVLAKVVVDELCRLAGWDGRFASIRDRTWRPGRLQFDL